MSRLRATQRTGMYWLNTQLYNPVLTRFVQPDLGPASSLFDYIYADGDSLDYTDPTGANSTVPFQIPVTRLSPPAAGSLASLCQ